MTHSTSSPDSPPVDLAVHGVLAEALPLDLGELRGPAKYTVTSVFTRRPLAEEISLIQGPATHERLSAAGYPDVALRVADRRLEIGSTSLDELKGGLAALIADTLYRIGVTVADGQATRDATAKKAGDRELARASAVRASAAGVSFDRESPPTSEYR
jgi:hypothetical protein